MLPPRQLYSCLSPTYNAFSLGIHWLWLRVNHILNSRKTKPEWMLVTQHVAWRQSQYSGKCEQGPFQEISIFPPNIDSFWLGLGWLSICFFFPFHFMLSKGNGYCERANWYIPSVPGNCLALLEVSKPLPRIFHLLRNQTITPYNLFSLRKKNCFFQQPFKHS